MNQQAAIKERLYVIRPEDCANGWRISKMAIDGLKQVAKEGRDSGKPVSVTIGEWEPPRTDPQRKTFWQWHGEVAAELTIRSGMRWTKDDVHEVVFLEKFMPRRELVDPQTGELKSRPLRTSEATKGQISEAMNGYLAWIYEQGIEVTVPVETW